MTAKGTWISFLTLLLVNLILAEWCIPGSYEPYPYKCEKYLKCEFGIFREKHCPNGLQWNDEYKSCDFPEYSNCNFGKGVRECNFGEYRRNSEDCASFYQCVNGILVSFKCPHGLHWNEKYAACDRPENSGCTVSIDTFKSTKKCKSGEYMADVTNCKNFMQCTNGILLSLHCPSGLHWNRELNICDWPEFANCNIQFNPESQKIRELTESCDQDNYISNPTNCNSFFQCVDGIPIEMPCPTGLHWSKLAKICDWPENAQCNIQLTTAESVDENNSKVSEIQQCKHGEYLPNSNDCGSFIQCVHGSPVYQFCPSGLHWNKLEAVCDWPKVANCIGETTTVKETTTSELNPGFEPETSTPGFKSSETTIRKSSYVTESIHESQPEPSTSISESIEINTTPETVTDPILVAESSTPSLETTETLISLSSTVPTLESISTFKPITGLNESTNEDLFTTKAIRDNSAPNTEEMYTPAIITEPSPESASTTSDSEITKTTLEEQSTTEFIIIPDSEPEPTAYPKLNITNTEEMFIPEIVTDPISEPEPTTTVPEVIETTFREQLTTELIIISDPEPTIANPELSVSYTEETYIPDNITDSSSEPEPTTSGSEVTETTMNEQSTTESILIPDPEPESTVPGIEQGTTLETSNETFSVIPEPDPTTLNPRSNATGDEISTISTEISSTTESTTTPIDPSIPEPGNATEDANVKSTAVLTTVSGTETEIISKETTEILCIEHTLAITTDEIINMTTTESVITPCIHEELWLNPNNCNSFLQCVHGTPVEMSCPTGLYWHNVIKTCDWPENTECHTVNITEEPNITTTEEISLSTDGQNETVSEKSTTISEPESEETTGATATKTFTEEIMTSLPVTEITDNTSLSNSEQNEKSTTEIAAPSIPEIETTSTVIITTTEASNNACIHEELLPNIKNCNSFLQCVHGTSVEKPCPKDLHWNDVLKLCDWPENTDCNIKSISNYTTTEESITSTIDKLESNETISKEVTESSTQITKDITMESLENTEEMESNESAENLKPCKHGDYLPNTVDCGSFYQCVHGKPVHMPCPAGLHWNNKAKVCDWPQSANCKIN